MLRKICYIILVFFLSFIFQEKVFAKEVVKECNYTYLNSVYENGNTTTSSYSEGGTINIKIYDDGSHSGQGTSSGFGLDDFGGSESLMNWGQEFNGIPNIKAVVCPDYIINTSEGWWEKSDRWYGVSSSSLMDSAKKLVGLSTSDTVIVLKNDELEKSRKTYTCNYDYYKITVDTDQRTLAIDSKVSTLNMFYWISDELRDTWFSKERKTDECLPTVACSDGVNLGGSVNYKVFNDSMEAAAAGYKKCENEDCSGEDCNPSGIPYSCPTYTKYLNDIDSLYSQIKASTGDVKTLYADVHAKEKRLGTLCNGVMASYDYSENCVKACVHVNSDIAKIKDKYGINSANSANANCSLSSRLVAWIMKFINWMRYIIPVLLIILSVLDYIKAIASDSEDEVKKVTSKFVKRLIVAVCIFLVPLALQFLLGIFGINANNFCL